MSDSDFLDDRKKLLQKSRRELLRKLKSGTLSQRDRKLLTSELMHTHQLICNVSQMQDLMEVL